MITVYGNHVTVAGVTVTAGLGGSITWDASGLHVSGCVIEATAKPK